MDPNDKEFVRAEMGCDTYNETDQDCQFFATNFSSIQNANMEKSLQLGALEVSTCRARNFGIALAITHKTRLATKLPLGSLREDAVSPRRRIPSPNIRRLK